jgi:hypothetical protein
VLRAKFPAHPITNISQAAVSAISARLLSFQHDLETSPMNHRFRFHRLADLRALPSRNHAPTLLTEGICDANIDAENPGNIRVTLWREWQAMLADLTGIGPVWSIVRNQSATLAVLGAYPALTFARDNQSALARRGDSALACHFRAWARAEAFDSGCRCGRLYGFEIANGLGEPFHRICLAKGTPLDPFIEWTQLHQATGLEDDDEALPTDHGRFHPQAFRRIPGTLEVPVARLRNGLVRAAQREIPLVAAVASEGVTQAARLDIGRASEAAGQLVLVGNECSLYVDAEPTGTLLAEPATLEGEPVWRLSLIDGNEHRLLHLQSTVDSRAAWNQLIREFVLCSSASEL